MGKARQKKGSKKKRSGSVSKLNRGASKSKKKNVLLKKREKSKSKIPVLETDTELPDEHDLAENEGTGIEELSFLRGVEKSLTGIGQSKRGKKRKRFDDEEEESFEIKPRHFNGAESRDHDDDVEVRHLLPLKEESGKLVMRKEVIKIRKEEKDEEIQKEEVEERSRDKTKKTKIQKLTYFCRALMENPEGNIGLLEGLLNFCLERDSENWFSIRKRAFEIALEIFQDIIPGYRIRSIVETDKLSKEVKKLTSFEDFLLKGYQRFLAIISETIQAARGQRKQLKYDVLLLDNETKISGRKFQKMEIIGVKCLCELLLSRPHFNFRTNLLAVLIPLMNDKTPESHISQHCCKTIATLFEQDTTCESSLEAVKFISRLVKTAKDVKGDVLDTFLSLQMQDVDVSSDVTDSEGGKSKKNCRRLEEKQRRKLSRKERKRIRIGSRVRKELKELEATANKEARAKLQKECLTLVMTCYFRILKNDEGRDKLLSSVLRGLGRFARLISIDYFHDLFRILEDVVVSSDVTVEQSLHCVLAALKILSGQTDFLNLDPRQFYTHLYTVMLKLESLDEAKLVPCILECLDLLFRKRRQFSTQRIFAFVKRISTLCLSIGAPAASGLLGALRSFIQAYPKSHQLLDSEAATSGLFQPKIDDPDLSNAGSTLLWELHLLRRHFDPGVRRFADHIALCCPSTGKGSLPIDMAKKDPLKLFEDSRARAMDCT